MKRALILFLFCASSLVAAQAPSPPRIVSPEVHADHSVTFRLRAPNAQAVKLTLEGATPELMTKGDDGVWSLTTAPLEPDFYGYMFDVDGVNFIDPSNWMLKPNLITLQSQAHVPGPPENTLWEVNDVPHGIIHHHFYKSGVAGDQRDYYVYTPPGYDPRAKTKYPVFYLLHGFSDDASGWTAVGRTNVIMDNLIAQGKAKAMLVVMPLGYGTPEIVAHGVGALDDTPLRDRNFNKFRDALLTEVMPQIESKYHAIKDRRSRAIAGLSMGGSESLLTGLNNLDKFAWIGAFSSGGLDRKFDADFPGLDARANQQIKLLWIACGTEDTLIDLNRKLRDWLKTKGVEHADIETPGAHTWMVWRRNLLTFAPLLFR